MGKVLSLGHAAEQNRGYGTQVLGYRHLKVVARALDAANASSHALDQRRIVGPDKTLGDSCGVGALHGVDAKICGVCAVQ